MALTPFTITGDTHELRPFALTDLPLIEEASADPHIPLITTVPATFTDKAGVAFLSRQSDRLETEAGWSVAIVDRSTDRAVGQIGLWIPNLDQGRAEIGYWVVGSGRGRGAAAVAVAMLTDWAFANTEVERVSLFIEPWNAASIRTAERCNFEREGLLRSWELVDGEPRDMWSYARLRGSRRPQAEAT